MKKLITGPSITLTDLDEVDALLTADERRDMISKMRCWQWSFSNINEKDKVMCENAFKIGYLAAHIERDEDV